MKIKSIGLCLFMFWLNFILLAQYAIADEKEYTNELWERGALYLGAYFIETKSNLKLGGVIDVNAENILGLEENFAVFRADAFWRITCRNRVDFTFYQMSRNASRFLGIEIPDGEGGSFPLGTRVKTDFDISVLRGSYAYSFVKNEHFDLAAAGGLFGLKVDFKMDSDESGKSKKRNSRFPCRSLACAATLL